MSKLFIFAMLFFMASSSFSQQKNVTRSLTKMEYLQKSKRQKTAAWVLLGGGFALAVGAGILDASSDWSKSETPYLVAISIGGASMLGSIPLFIDSGRNKRKARNASAYFEIQQKPVPTNTGLTLLPIPALALKLTF